MGAYAHFALSGLNVRATNALKSNPTITKNLAVTEGNALSNIFENIAHWRYEAYGFILSANSSEYARLDDEDKSNIALTWFNLVSASAMAKQSIMKWGGILNSSKYIRIF